VSLVPAASFILGNFRYDSHAAAIAAPLALLPGVNSFRVMLPASAQLDAEPGEDASLTLDGGEGAETVLTGKISSIRRGFQTAEVVVVDGASQLAAFRPAATYEKQAAKEVIRGLASEASIDIGNIDLDVQLAAYVAHQRRTAAEHIAYLATLAGAVARFEPDGKLTVTAPSDTAEMALLYGREISAARVCRRPPPAVQRFAIGNGPAGSANAPDALRHTTSRLPGDAAAPGASVVWDVNHVLRVPSAAVSASSAATTRFARKATTITADCFLLPKLRPGMVIEIQELPNGLSGGPWMLTRVEHRLSPTAGGATIFAGISAGEAGLGGALGALAGSVGGLL
jgi:hypothetical protein